MQPVIALSRAFDVEIIALLLTLPRIFAFLAASQIFNSSVIPGMPRIVAVIALAIIAVPINLDQAAAMDRSAMSLIGHFLKEYAIGFLLGYMVGWIFWVVQAAGGLIDNQRGAAIASSMDPLVGEEATPLGNLFSQAFLTYVFASGAFLPVLGLVYKSFVLWPATRMVPIISDVFPKMLLAMFDTAMELAVTLAAPIIAIMFAAEFSMAMISRFAPQIQVFVLAMPIKSMLAIIILIFYFQTVLPYATKQLVNFELFADKLYDLLTFGETVTLPSANPRGPR